MLASEQQADSVQNLLSLLVDGGDTEELNFEIQTSWPDEAAELYNELINESPYLSDTVMISAVEKEDVLPSAMVTDILSVNPQAAKSNEVMQAVNERVNQLSNEQLAEINEGFYITGAKESLEAKLSYYNAERRYALNNIVRYFRNDTISPAPYDSIVDFLEAENKLWAEYALAFEYLEKGDTANVTSTLSDIPLGFELSATQNTEYQLYEDYFDVLLELYVQDVSIYEMDSTQISILYDIGDDAPGRLKSYIKNILIAIDTLEYNEPYIFPEEGYKSSKIITKPLSKSYEKNNFKLYPNPAGDYVIIEYTLSEDTPEGWADFINGNGKLVKSIAFNDRHDYLVVSLKGLPSGIYLCCFRLNGKIHESHKLIILY